jgi:hypothetical protein
VKFTQVWSLEADHVIMMVGVQAIEFQGDVLILRILTEEDEARHDAVPESGGRFWTDHIMHPGS